MLYLNPAGLSPFLPDVQEEVTRTLDTFANLLFTEAGIQHYRDTLQQCRQSIAAWLNVRNEQRLAFTSNATTACSLLLSRITWNRGDVLLTTTHENATILQELSEVEARGVEILSIDSDSPADFLSQCSALLAQHPVRAMLVSHVSHIDGRIFPVASLQHLAPSSDTRIIVDGAQAVGHIPVSFQEFHLHAYFFPGHKWCAGPMGTGALILQDPGEQMMPADEHDQVEQEHPPLWMRYELGTLNIGLIAGLAKACALLSHMNPDRQKLEQARNEWKAALSQCSGIKILEWDGPHAPGILSFVCLTDHAEQRIRRFGSTHNLAWKMFTHPAYPANRSFRVSWTTWTLNQELSSALARLSHEP